MDLKIENGKIVAKQELSTEEVDKRIAQLKETKQLLQEQLALTSDRFDKVSADLVNLETLKGSL